jgi:hypothetical protein
MSVSSFNTPSPIAVTLDRYVADVTSNGKVRVGVVTGPANVKAAARSASTRSNEAP